jgi:hypothetical protein
VNASDLARSQRRFEAESYLSEGFRVRHSIESKSQGWVKFAALATASAPPRIKQILVSPENGTPYLNTSQVFDPRPLPRKWLSMEKTTKASDRLVRQGQILVMASATVGRAIVASKAHENTVISHHFMRVRPNEDRLAGWIYGYLRSPHALLMMSGSQYASVIRHIEPHHLAALPVPEVADAIAMDFNSRVETILRCRNDAISLRTAAEDAFSEAIGPLASGQKEFGFTVPVSNLLRGRRRFEAAYYSPHAQSIIDRFAEWNHLGDLTDGIWWGQRFKRHYGKEGIPYLSADDLFTTNPYAGQKILVSEKDGHEKFFVRQGWLLMACSGQTYGLNGSVTIASQWHEDTFLSHDLIRIIPNSTVRPGFLFTALTHPLLGRPLLIREAYGMSIPHLDPDDVSHFPVVRLGESVEGDIADLAEKAVAKQHEAEVLERRLSEAAGAVIDAFVG